MIFHDNILEMKMYVISAFLSALLFINTSIKNYYLCELNINIFIL